MNLICSPDSTTASQLIQALFQSPLTNSDLNLLLLAATAIIEAEPDTIDLILQRQIADALFQHYTVALRTKKYEHCYRIEQTMIRWLLTLPKDAFRPPVLLSLLNHIIKTVQAEQRATLKLLAMIMPNILTGSSQIFNTLMPVLLAIAGLPAVEGNEQTVKPSNDVPTSSDPTVRDYAFTVLSVMGRRGPGGLLLSKIREEVEPYLEHLAYYSLDCGMLITPTNIPLAEEKYVHYEKAIGQWILLRDERKKRLHTEADVQRCTAIHKALLAHAEEVNYAMASMIATMLTTSAHSSDDWKQTWQGILLNQLQTGQDITYFNSALLWTALFIEEDEQKPLAMQVKQDFQHSSKQLFSTRFIAYIAEDFRCLRGSQAFQSSQVSRDLQYLQDFRSFQVLQISWITQDLRVYRYFRHLQYFRYLRYFLLITEFTQICLVRIPYESSEVQVDLLLILLGRILQIGEDAPDTSPEQKTQQEIHYIVQQITPFCTSTNDDVRDAALDILPYLPVRTEHEIRFVIEGAEQAKDGQVRDAYCDALRRARPLKSEWDMLKRMGMQSQVKGVRAATEEAMKRRR